MVDLAQGAKCSACNTPLSQEGDSEGLCPSCLLELALDDTSFEAEVLGDPEEAPTLQYSGYTFEEGQIQGERYRVRSLLGRGGMGEVWRAYDLKLRQDVALKALRTELIKDSDALETLRQEVRTAREVISPNVCRVFDLQELDGQELVAMEYIDGTTLQEILRERSPLDLDEAREIASQFLAGLEAIHHAGLVHRDIKPENVMVTRTGRVVVMDFGIAKGLGDGKGGLIAGTPAYMSPEQSRGDELDARSDVFSAGVVLAEMVAPEGVHSLEDRRQLWEAIHQETPEIAETPWWRVIGQCVSTDQGTRYTTAAELARALEEVTLRAVGDDTARPYPGLSAFQEEDAKYFYGRELEVEALWKKLRRPHLLAVIGPSGAGKSSFLRAGLLPTLTDGWEAIISTPGNLPFANLAQALAPQLGEAPGIAELMQRFDEPDIAVELLSEWRQGAKHALLIVDQFEELFTQCSPDVQVRFAELLGRLPLEADLFVLLSMRDDFLFHCHRFEAFQPILTDLTLLGPPTGAALRRALVEPALRCGYRFEDESIVEEMLGEVEGQRGALPLLAFGAAQLWERRDRETGLLTRKSYEQIGGVSGALAQHAEAMLDYIGESNIPIVRELFRNLVTAQGTRAARDRDELLSVFNGQEPAGTGAGRFNERERMKRPAPLPADGPGPRTQDPGSRGDAANVLNSLIDARLLTSYEVPATDEGGEPRHRIELVHESLLARWPRLVRWQREDADSAQMRDELRSQAKLWNEHGRSEDYLWTGTAFKEYELWRERYSGGLTEAEEAFTKAMVSLAARRKRRRRIAISAAFAILLAVLGVIGWFGWQAELERRRAEAGKLMALGELEVGSNPTAALAWATKSIEVSDTPEGRLLALRALQKSPPARTLQNTDKSYAVALAFNPSGTRLATGGWDRVGLNSQNGGEPVLLHRYSSGGPPATIVRFQSEEVLVAEREGEIRWFSIPEGKESRLEYREGRWGGQCGNRGYLRWIVEDGQESLYLWPFGQGDPRLVGTQPEAFWQYDKDCKWLAFVRNDAVYLRSLEDWDLPPRIIGQHSTEIKWLAFHPASDQVAAVDELGETKIWSLVSSPAKPLRIMQTGNLGFLRYDPSGRWLAGETNIDGIPALKLWDLTAPADVEPLVLVKADEPLLNAFAFHPSDPWVVTSHNGNASFWPLPGFYPWVLRGGGADDLEFTADGDWLISTKETGLRAWPLKGQNKGKSRLLIEDRLRFYSAVGLDPSGTQVAVATAERGVLLVPLSGGPERELPGRWSGVFGMHFAFSPDGRLLAAVPDNGQPEEMVIRVWDLESGQIQSETQAPGNFTSLSFDDNQHLRFSFGPFDPEKGSGGGEKLFNLEDGGQFVVEETGREYLREVSSDREFMIVAELEGSLRSTTLHSKSLVSDESRLIDYDTDLISAIRIDDSNRWMVTGDSSGVVRVGPVSGEKPHLLLGKKAGVNTVAISPDGRWVAASGVTDGTIRIWPTPDLSKPPLHTLPHDELIAKLHSLTNLRIIEDPESSTGWKLDYAPFPGWAEVPEW